MCTDTVRKTEEKFTRWVACWGNATSISNQKEAMYSRNVTLRYPVRMCFSGAALRFHFSNLTGTEPITIEYACVSKSDGDKCITSDSSTAITVGGRNTFQILPGEEICSDTIPFAVIAGSYIAVSFYLKDYTQMNAGVLITGPLSKGYYAYGDYAKEASFPAEKSRSTKWFYFLNTIDVLTEKQNRAFICYGDSITAQSWPDYLSLYAWEMGVRNISIIRRAVSGTRILRQYDCITYAAYGLKGENRFEREINVAGAESVLIQHGINDIIHPVGIEVNPFRPWSDMPSLNELIHGFETIYIDKARKNGLKVYAGTLLPIYGWRTYAPFRNELKDAFNDWLRTTPLLDGVIDFDAAVRDPMRPEAFAEGFDSGDHLHPSEAAYKKMAECIFKEVKYEILYD